MLQRLKLQQGRESQTSQRTPLPITSASTGGQDGASGSSNLQKVDNSPVNGFEFSSNGIPSKELRTSAVDSNSGLGGGEIQQPGFAHEVDSGFISSSTQKGNTDGDRGDNRVLGQVIQPGITPTGTGQLLPAKSLKDADITSLERTDGERVSFGSSAMTRHTPGNNYATTSIGYTMAQDQVFQPKVYMWSLKSTDANLNAGGQEDKGFRMGNGGHGAFSQSKDTQIVPADQKTANNSLRRKQRSSENKTKRWTQKIKERWRDRSGTFGKKEKEETLRENQKSEQETEISPQNQPLTAESLINISNKETERTDDSTKEGNTRCASDFEFGLGSFSLLEEIATGQEWAKFLNPNQSAASANQRPSEEVTTSPNPHDSSRSSVSDFGMAQISPDAFQPVSMDISAGKQQQYVHNEAEQSEPMEDAHTQLNIQSADGGLGQQLRPPSFVQPANIPRNSALKSRGHLNRKRQHQSAESTEERLQTEKRSDAKEADRDGSKLSQTGNHMMEETGQTQHDSTLPLYTLNSPPPPTSPSSFNPFAPAPKGVLRHSLSRESESSVEIVSKRRRVEENRRVHFSENVVTIAPPELNMETTDSEEESGAEEDSVTEQECEVEQAAAAVEEVALARRPALPAWIKALKRRNTGRKHR